MYYECKQCKAEEFRGVLPGMSSLMLLLVWTAMCFAAVFCTISILFPGGIRPFGVIVWPVSFTLSMVPGGIIIDMIACGIEWLLISAYPCRRCGSHRFWFGPGNTGFGL